MPEISSSNSSIASNEVRSTATAAGGGLRPDYKGRGPGPYQPGSSWQTWTRLFEFSIKLRKVIDEDEKKLILFQEMGASNFELLDSLLLGKSLDDVSYEECLKVLGFHFTPKKLIMAERYKLMNLQQKPGQTLADYYAELQRVAKDCGFDKITDFRDAQVTMVFLGGIVCVETRKRLLEKTSLTSKEALESAEAFQQVGKNAPHLKDTSSSNATIGKVHEHKGRDHHKTHSKFRSKTPFGRNNQSRHEKSRNNESNHHRSQLTCYCCGKVGHKKEKCFLRNKAVCSKCNSKGHLREACRGSRRVDYCENLGASDDEYVGHVEHIARVSARKRRKAKNQTDTRVAHRSNGLELMSQPGPIDITSENGPVQVSLPIVEEVSTIVPACLLSINMNERPISCELDTGACISIINKRIWDKIGKPTLEPPSSKATAYNGSPLNFAGKCKVALEFQGKFALMDMHVLEETNSRALCGRDMIQKLEIDCGPHLKLAHKVNPTAVKISQLSVPDDLNRILKENSELFTPGLGKCKTVTATLKMKDDTEVTPKIFRPRPVPYALRGKVEEKIAGMVKNGILTPVEHSQWGTPLVVVPKPGNNVRICGDYKVTINPILDINQYPLPIPEDMFHQLNGGQKFSKMDLSDAYMQVELDEKSKEFTTINTPKGLFRYNRVPFGVASAPAIFQKIMETTLGGLEGVMVYLDDITVTAPDDIVHLERLEKVLNRLNKAGFKLKKDKCEFLKEEMEFLGHVVDKRGIRPSQKKLTAMLNMPEPRDVKGIESFIGMVQYYGKFIPNLSTLASPLNALRRKDVEWNWGAEQNKAFQDIKKRLTETDVLTHYDPKIPVVLATDASDYGIGAVIYHTYSDKSEKVIAYASRTLTKEERNYAQIEKEALGIVWGVEKFSQFLYGRKFTLLTDHQPLVKIFGPKQGLPVIAAKRLHRWGLRLMVYSFEIQYRNTHEFGNADGLSRLPDPRELPSAEMIINEIEVLQVNSEVLRDLPMNEQEIAKTTSEDSILACIKNFIENGWPETNKNPHLNAFFSKRIELTIHHGCLMWDQRVVIPAKFQMRVLETLHNSHYGRNRMISLARMKVWFPGIDSKIEQIAQSCEICAKLANDPHRVPLHPWEEPQNPWQRLHMDFCETENNDRWLIVVCAKSKWPSVIKMGSTTTERTTHKLRELFSVHGLPEQIVADNGPQFASKQFREFCEQRNIELTLTPAYHPNSNGEAERFVQTFKNALYKSTRAGKTIEDAVIDLMLQYRATTHPATGKSPAEVLMQRKLRTRLDIIKSEKKTIPHNKYREDLSKYYKGSKPRQFEVGQEVYLRNYAPRGDKWMTGIVTKQISGQSYEVHYGSGTRICHTDQLKRKVTFEFDCLGTNGENSEKQNSEETQKKTPEVIRRSSRITRQPDRYSPERNKKIGQVHQIMEPENGIGKAQKMGHVSRRTIKSRKGTKSRIGTMNPYGAPNYGPAPPTPWYSPPPTQPIYQYIPYPHGGVQQTPQPQVIMVTTPTPQAGPPRGGRGRGRGRGYPRWLSRAPRFPPTTPQLPVPVTAPSAVAPTPAQPNGIDSDAQLEERITRILSQISRRDREMERQRTSSVSPVRRRVAVESRSRSNSPGSRRTRRDRD